MINECKNKFKSAVLRHLGLHPTSDQEQALNALIEFLYDVQPNPLFILMGYAGTGKTGLIAAFIKACNEYNVKTVLMAPTGRAAKVLSNYSKKQASTIHKRIYYRVTDKQGNVYFRLQQNLHKRVVFVVDEASMISDSATDFGDSLLHDLLFYVYSGSFCRLILIGDNAQLPPIGFSNSPALEAEYLNTFFPLSIHTAHLKQVVRQNIHSGILYNATWLRIQMYQNPKLFPKIKTNGFVDVVRISGEDLPDCLEKSYKNYGEQGTVVITRSNKNANLYNKFIRERIKWAENLIEAGDICMVVKNNYFWLDNNSTAEFIANGDFIEIEKIFRIKELYGYKFAEAKIRLLDYPDHPPIEVTLWLNALDVEAASMPETDVRKLFNDILADYHEETNKIKRKELVKNNPYFNALQIKFGYCITCHKSQGGQWEDVYIDPGYLTSDMINEDFFRWLYTAITRATKHVYLVKFKDDFFKHDE